ncbi:hypothetical protein IFM89_034996 [Coptis chinensis]|uniref:FAE domain-containing protein n=1 Tax=Coptis chinensis TaxID=261450 RepID=A0A835ISH1_9MAGN|nr:hypothetical protein IFM89_034996 [Coptis chinensis]
MRILERLGLGDETCLPPTIHYIPPKPNMEAARTEAELVIFFAINSLMKKTGLKPKDIDILVLNCSMFSPTPSTSAMIVNKYKLRSNIRSFNLFGMGCSAGLISIDLACDLLQVHPNSNALLNRFALVSVDHIATPSSEIMLPLLYMSLGGWIVFLNPLGSMRYGPKIPRALK